MNKNLGLGAVVVADHRFDTAVNRRLMDTGKLWGRFHGWLEAQR